MNTYNIIKIAGTLYPFAIISGITCISSHKTEGEAKRVQAGYYAGDRYHAALNS